ncbi:MAG: M20/M25/M40 family metallo-hydrolase [Lachnospiraceae bacterium]
MNKEFLYEMLSTASVSGNEVELEEKIYKFMKSRVEEVRSDEIGNVIAVLNPESKFKVLLSGHADEIGLMVTAVLETGMLKVVGIGGIYVTCYPGQKVQVHTKNGVVYGAVCNNRELSKKSDMTVKDLTIDIGANSKEDALKAIALGDTITFDTEYRELLNDGICGRALDDRVGAFIVMEALNRAKEKGCKVGAYSAATVGEETTRNGAYFVGARIKPTLAVAVDVTYASDEPGIDIASTGDIKVGAGPVICNNPSIHKKINAKLYKAAENLGMKVQTEAANGRTGTDGDTIHLSGEGVPFALVSIPLRYMHTPAEVGSLKDIQDCIELLAEFLCSFTGEECLKFF